MYLNFQIEGGEIHAKINCEDSTIMFNDQLKKYEDSNVLKKLLNEVK